MSTTDARLTRAITQLDALLVPGETLQAYAAQRRLFALSHRRLIIAATSGRLIIMARRFISGFHTETIRWQDLKETSIDVGTFGATLSIVALSGPDVTMAEEAKRVQTFAGLDKAAAQEVYTICQAQDQAWREKRRVRDLEELRARSGGIQMSTPAAVAAGPSGATDGDPVARLERAKEMLQKGLISDAEFENLKARIVGSL